jgi:hypothetical protein
MSARRVVAMPQSSAVRKAADKQLTTPALMAAIARPSLILGGAIGHVSSALGGSGLVRLRLLEAR